MYNFYRHRKEVFSDESETRCGSKILCQARREREGVEINLVIERDTELYFYVEDRGERGMFFYVEVGKGEIEMGVYFL